MVMDGQCTQMYARKWGKDEVERAKEAHLGRLSLSLQTLDCLKQTIQFALDYMRVLKLSKVWLAKWWQLGWVAFS
jgi:hypothetical protein